MADRKIGEGALTRMLQLGLHEVQAMSGSFFQDSPLLQDGPAVAADGPAAEPQPEAAPATPDQEHDRGRGR